MDNRSWYDIGIAFKLHQCLYLLETYENKRMKTGIFSGSFNPFTSDTALANYLCEYEGLDEVWFLVTPHNPLKEEDELMDDTFRLKLVQLAIAGYPKFKASDIEFNLPRPSYTIHTLDKLKETYPDREFHLIIGSDNWALFPRWYQSERILAENHVLCISPSRLSGFFRFPFGECKSASSPTFEISSTFIRRAMEEGKDVRYFLHPAVYEALQLHIPVEMICH